MARLNEASSASGHQEAIEALKKRYLRQNREIARANSQQSIRIRSLESESTRLLSENISLREQVIKLQASIDRRDRSRQFSEAVEATQKKLQEKVDEVNELVKELGYTVTTSQTGRRAPGTSTTYNPRLPRGSIILGESLDGALPSIQEDARSRRSSLNEERRRSSLNFEEVDLPPPMPQESDSDEDLQPPISSFIESRPRRRRDSTAVQELENPIFAPQPSTSRAVKRKFTEKEAETVPSSPPDLDFRFSKVSERAAEAAKRKAEIEQPNFTELLEDEVLVEEPESERTVEKRSTTTAKSAASNRLNQGVPDLGIKSSSSSRKALGPKSTNLDPMNSPLKASSRKDKDDAKIFDKLEKPDHPPPAIRSYRSSSMRDKDTPPPDSDPSTVVSSSGRSARRVRSSVSYAEPSLRAKMRREEKGLVDAVIGEGKTRRSTSRTSTGKKKDGEPEMKIKKEETEDDGGWLGLPVQLKPSELEPELMAKSNEDAFIAQLDKQRERRERDSADQEKGMEGESETGLPLPSSVMTHRKRRSSSLVRPAAGLQDSPPRSSKEAPTSPGEVRRKIDIFEAPSSSPPDLMRKSHMKTQVEPTTMGDDDEPAKSTASIASSAESKRISRMRSISSLAEEGEKKIATRRKSMML